MIIEWKLNFNIKIIARDFIIYGLYCTIQNVYKRISSQQTQVLKWIEQLEFMWLDVVDIKIGQTEVWRETSKELRHVHLQNRSEM